VPVEGHPQQTEEGISDVIQRARQRRLQRKTAAYAAVAASDKLTSNSAPKTPALLGRQSMLPRDHEG